MFKRQISETILQMKEKRKIAEAQKIVGSIVWPKYRQTSQIKRIFNPLEVKLSACLMKIKRMLKMHMEKNMMQQVMETNSEIYLEVKAFTKDKEEVHFTPC